MFHKYINEIGENILHNVLVAILRLCTQLSMMSEIKGYAVIYMNAFCRCVCERPTTKKIYLKSNNKCPKDKGKTSSRLYMNYYLRDSIV